MGKFDFVGTTSRVLSNEKYPGCPFQPDSYHLILIAVKRELEIVCQLVEAIRKLVITPMIVLLPDHSEMRNKIIYLGGRCGIDTTVYSGRSQSAVVCIDSPLYRMEIGKKRRNPCYGGKTENPSTSKNSRMGA